MLNSSQSSTQTESISEELPWLSLEETVCRLKAMSGLLYFPKNYIVFDVETSGVDRVTDLILQFGHLGVQNCKVDEGDKAGSALLNWANHPAVDEQWLRTRMDQVRTQMKEKGKGNYKFTYDNMAAHGKDAETVLRAYHTTFQQFQDEGGWFVTHNGLGFDVEMVENHFRRFLNVDFRFDRTRVFDTGLLEKAIENNIKPFKDEGMLKFLTHTSKRFGKKPWSLANHCFHKYRLAERYGLTPEQAHEAGFDCILTYLVFETMRDLAGC